jgi:hypothetical protein
MWFSIWDARSGEQSIALAMLADENRSPELYTCRDWTSATHWSVVRSGRFMRLIRHHA